jgi:uncharacterized membrane-anchored protein
VSAGTVLLLVLAVAATVAVALLVSDVGSVYPALLAGAWQNFVSWLGGLFQ